MKFLNAFGFSSASDNKKKRRSSDRKRAILRKSFFEHLERRELFTTSPFYIKNFTPFEASEVNIAMFGKDYDAVPNNYYFDQNGCATLTSALGAGNPIPTFQLGNLTYDNDKAAYVINLPQFLGGGNTGIQSARLYFGMGPDGVGNPLGNMTVAADGSVNSPVMGNNFFDYVELSLNASGNTTGNQTDLNIDTSQVDAMGFPITVHVDSTEKPSDVGVYVPRDQVIQAYENYANGTPFMQSLWPVNDPTTGQPYRITNPSDVLSNIALQTNVVQVETTLMANMLANATTLTVYDAEAFPNPTVNGNFTINVIDNVGGNETMTVTGLTLPSNGQPNYIWTVTRTNPVAHSIGNTPIFIVPEAPAISASQTTITIEGNSGFPTGNFAMQIGNGTQLEIVNVIGSRLNKDGTVTYTVERGQGINGNVAHNNGDLVHASVATNNLLNIHFNEAVDDLFSAYYFGNGTAPGNTSLMLQLTGIDGDTYGGYVTNDGNGCTIMRFNNLGNTTDTTNYDVYYPFFNDNELYWAGYDPQFGTGFVPSDLQAANSQVLSPSLMVFACNGVFADSSTRAGLSTDQQKLLGNLENQIVSALNRGIANFDTSDWDDPTKYYTGEIYNCYAQFFHDNNVTLNNQAYAFAFDDQQGQASDIAVSKFASATITLGFWATFLTQGDDLLVAGTAGDDTITVQDLGKKKGIQVVVNGDETGTFKGLTGRIIVDGLTGNDVISINKNVKLAAALYGSYGDDILIGGTGLCTFDGGEGKNMIIGRTGRDIVVDGGGVDQLIMSKKTSYWSTVADALAPLSKNKKLPISTYGLLKKLIK